MPLIHQTSSGCAAIFVGMAQAAIDEVVALSRTKNLSAVHYELARRTLLGIPANVPFV